MADYISIREFADLSGVSTSAIYQRLERDLKPYLYLLNGKKMIDSSALKVPDVALEDLKVDLDANKSLEDLKQIEILSRNYDPIVLKEQLTSLKDQNNNLQNELSKVVCELSKALEDNRDIRAELSKALEDNRDMRAELSKALEDNRVLQSELYKERENNRLQTDTIADLASKCAELGHGAQELGRGAQFLLAANEKKQRDRWRFPWSKKTD